MAESFDVYHNNDYTTNALAIVHVGNLVEETARSRERAQAEAESDSSSSKEEILQPCHVKTFSDKSGEIVVTVGLQLNPLEAKRRAQSSDYLLSIFYQISSENRALDGSFFLQDQKIFFRVKVYTESTDAPRLKQTYVQINDSMGCLYSEKSVIQSDDSVLGLDFSFDFSSLQEEPSDDYPGLVNMGMTCYMNSYLQSMFHIKLFVRQIFKVDHR